MTTKNQQKAMCRNCWVCRNRSRLIAFWGSVIQQKRNAPYQRTNFSTARSEIIAGLESKGNVMSKSDVTPLDRSLARICELCPVCRHARRSQEGIAFII